MHSCLYEGRVWHRRRDPVNHQFRYRLFMAYLDLDELPEIRRNLLGRRKSAAVSYPGDVHLTNDRGPLSDRVRRLVRERTGRESSGPIRLLTQLRSFGYYFSPLNLFYCFDRDGQRLECVLAEVNNTPWGEQHHYVLWEGNQVGDAERGEFRHAKQFHVSPFMDMDVDYVWRLTPPGANLGVRIDNVRNSGRFFQAGMVLRRRPLEKATLRAVARRHPWMTGRIMTAIYYQALRLWMKKCPYYPHPNKQRKLAAETR